MSHKPCPFCGSKNLSRKTTNSYVECEDCGCFGPSANCSFDTSEELRNDMSWNIWDERHEEPKTKNT